MIFAQHLCICSMCIFQDPRGLSLNWRFPCTIYRKGREGICLLLDHIFIRHQSDSMCQMKTNTVLSLYTIAEGQIMHWKSLVMPPAGIGVGMTTVHCSITFEIFVENSRPLTTTPLITLSNVCLTFL